MAQELLASPLIADVIVRTSLEKKLAEGKALRIKIGMDPTAPDLHIGHAVALRLLKQFQDAGHTIVFIIGDYTARIGDPSGKSKTRPQLDASEIDANAQTYLAQVGKILDVTRAEVVMNSTWLSKLSFADLIHLTAHFTVARLLERDDFAKRLKAGVDISAHELLYPMMQAYDSVAVSADVEVGGTDQTFNMLAGRELQKKSGMREQDVMTVPLLVGLDGVNKMSKSLGNYIALTDAPADMYGKVMSIPDSAIEMYAKLATDFSQDEQQKLLARLATGENPRDIKMAIAQRIVTMYHDAPIAQQAQEQFVTVFQKKEQPTEIEEMIVDGTSLSLAEILVATGLATSKTDARRVIEQGGVKVDGRVVLESAQVFALAGEGVLLQKGKRHFLRVKGE